MRMSLLCFLVLVACGSDSNGTDAGAGGDATGDGRQGTGCGGIAGRPCAATEYCDFAGNHCGVGDQTGTCQPRPSACPAVIGPPICGCDGQVHPGECATYYTGTDLNANGSCTTELTKFACGYTQCDLATQYCRREPQASGDDRYTCAALPAGCGPTPTCDCVMRERCGTSCTNEGKGGLIVTCP
jgi:hypothetical protein